MSLSLDEPGRSYISTSPSPGESSAKKGGDVYAPMSTIKQSLEVVMSGQVETLRVSFISVEWQLGNTPLPPPPDPDPNLDPDPDPDPDPSGVATPDLRW